MCKNLLIIVVVFLGIGICSAKSNAQLSQVADRSSRQETDYPFKPVPFTKVQFTDDFWLPRIEVNRTATIPFAFKMCEDTHRIENFKVAGGLSDKKWQGAYGFNDSDLYKVIEGAAYAMMVKPDPQLEKYVDEIISYIAAAQEDNGYLYTAWTARAKDHLDNVWCCYNEEPWDNLEFGHELYNVGHMYEAAVAHYEATGKRTFLNVAIKNADLVCETFGPGKNEGVPGHQEIEIGLVRLYRATGNEKYLIQSRWFLDRRGRAKGSEYSQGHKPVVEQDEAVGHAVRATYMYSAMADVAALTGEQAFVKAVDTLWDNVTHKKFYVTGGIGARHSGEAFGDNYELPNHTAYCETCAAIANVFWNHRMFLFHGESKYLDIMERSLYNAVISGVSLDGMTFFYPNPLETASGIDRSPWFGCACCPSNICRFMASLPGYAYAVRNDEVYVNLFVDSKAEFDVDGKSVKVSQETLYPWQGKIAITFTPQSNAQQFSLNVRIPSWAKDQQTVSKLYTFTEPVEAKITISVNGKDVPVNITNGFACINRKWKQGDLVKLNLPMPVRRITCDEQVDANIGRSAIQRGPIVYCVEWPDVENNNPLNLVLPKDATLTAEHKPDLLGGVTVLEGKATEVRRIVDSEDYERKTCDFKAIPYYAWSHRGKGAMTVWLPYTEKMATPLPAPTIASQSKVTVSNMVGGDNSLKAINDQQVPKASSDKSLGIMHFWPRKGTAEWIQYTFEEPDQISSVAVFWFDDRGHGECRIPKSWVLKYREDGQWKGIENFSDYKVTRDDFDRISFVPVTTDALRLEFQLEDNFSTGIQEWIVE